MSSVTLTPHEEAVLEVLAARLRLGHSMWTFPVHQEHALASLRQKGYVFVMQGVAEGTIRAGLEPKGKEAVLSNDYKPPTPRTILVHLNITVPPGDTRTADAVADAIQVALQNEQVTQEGGIVARVMNDPGPHHILGLGIEIPLAEEI